VRGQRGGGRGSKRLSRRSARAALAGMRQHRPHRMPKRALETRARRACCGPQSSAADCAPSQRTERPLTTTNKTHRQGERARGAEREREGESGGVRRAFNSVSGGSAQRRSPRRSRNNSSRNSSGSGSRRVRCIVSIQRRSAGSRGLRRRSHHPVRRCSRRRGVCHRGSAVHHHCSRQSCSGARRRHRSRQRR
jgi:hypothetical protein